MATMTLPEFKKLVRDELVAGVIEDIYTTNPVWSAIPWTSFNGSGIIANREKVLGDADFVSIGGSIITKAPSQNDKITFEPTSCIGDAEINKLEIAMSGSDINDIVSIEISSKAKSVGRKLQQGFATGTGSAPQMNSLPSMVDSAQYVTGGPLQFGMFDALTDLVKSKDGFIDWIMMHGRDLRAYRTMLRSLGGVPMLEVKVGDRTVQIDQFNGIPIYQNDWLSITETPGGADLVGGALSSAYAGVWDDGSKKIGVAMIYPAASPSGIFVEPIGAMEQRDEDIYRVKAYTNLAIFNRRGVARLTDLTGDPA